MTDEKIRTVVLVDPGKAVGVLDLPDYPAVGFQEAMTKAFADWSATTTVSMPSEVIAVIGDTPICVGEYCAMMRDLQRLGYRFSFISSPLGGLAAAIEAMDSASHEVKCARKPPEYLKHDPTKRHSRRGRGRRHERPFE